MSEEATKAYKATEVVTAPTPTPSEADLTLEAARAEASAIRQSAIEEAKALTEKVASVVPQVNPAPAEVPANVVPEPVPSVKDPREVPTFFPGIRRFDY